MLEDVIDRLRDMLELDPAVIRDVTRQLPDTWDVNTVYAYPSTVEQFVRNTESGPARQEEFDVTITYVADAPGDEASQRPSAEVTAILSSKRDEYLVRLSAIESCDLWDHVEGTAEIDNITNFEGRALSVRARGYRFLN